MTSRPFAGRIRWEGGLRPLRAVYLSAFAVVRGGYEMEALRSARRTSILKPSRRAVALPIAVKGSMRG
jgi:hypothetical protein